MYNLFKPYGKISWEKEFVGKYVNILGLDGPEPAQEEIDAKLAVCDILQADVDIQVNKELFDKAPNLKAVFCTSIGLDYVDIEEATRRGILIAHNPDFCILAVAEYAVGMMYAVMRNIPGGAESVKAGRWSDRGILKGAELYGKTLGVVGFGKTGREVARQAMGIGMNVVAYDPYMNHELAESMGVKATDMDEVLREGDIITVHVPLMDATRGLIGRKQFAMMKDGVYFINVARGGIVEEDALYEALASGKAAGAAIDVMSKEPPEEDSCLLQYEGKNLIITPHIAWYTAEAAEKNHEFFAEQVKSFTEGELPKATVNKEVFR